MSVDAYQLLTSQINWRMRVTLNDGRAMTGQMLAFDKVRSLFCLICTLLTSQHMNLVLADTEEFRRIKRKAKSTAPGATPQLVESEEKRTLGLTIVRGAHIISLSVESPPPADPSARLGKSAPSGIPSGLTAGPGVAKPAGRGAPPSSLAVSYYYPRFTPLANRLGSGCWRWRRCSSRLPWIPRRSRIRRARRYVER